MTKTTAKLGMLEYKIGYSHNEFDFDFIENIPYNDKILVKHLVSKLNDAIGNNNKEIVALNKKLDTLEQEKKAQDKLIRVLTSRVNALENFTL